MSAHDEAIKEAEATERALREQVGDLIRTRQRAESEARRLADRAARGDADPTLAEIVETYRSQASRLGGEIESVRSSLRSHEADLERLRAERASGEEAPAA